MEEVEVNEIETKTGDTVNVDTNITIDYRAPQFDIDRAIADIRKALAGEEKTIAEYIEYANEVNEWFPTLALLFRDIADEEKVHVGELKAILKRFEDNHAFMKQGAEEVANLETKFASMKAIEQIEAILAELEENENYTDEKSKYKFVIEKLLNE